MAKNWTARLLGCAMCATAVLSALLVLFVLSSAVLPVQDWLAAARSHGSVAQWRARFHELLPHPFKVSMAARNGHLLWGRELPPVDSDDVEEDEDCDMVFRDWKYGNICVVSR